MILELADIRIHIRRACKKWADDGAPFGEGGGLSEADGVVFKCVPKNLQQVALWAFDAFVDFVALTAFGFGNHGGKAAFDGFVKSSLLTRVDADVGEF